MISAPDCQKRYASARQRFLKASIEGFLQKEFPKLFGPVIREKVAEEITDLVNRQLPKGDHLRPGQVVWNAVSVYTRPDDPARQLVPVILTLVDPSDVEELARGTLATEIAQKAIARITREAYEQGALLSMRDIALLVWRDPSGVSKLRLAWEKRCRQTLPHTGSLQDFGSCITHKAIIVRKVVLDKQDPLRVARDTKHTPRAVDRYLKDYHRVRTCFEENKNPEFISRATGLAKHVIRQYLEIIRDQAQISS